MTPINFRKLVTHKEVLSILTHLESEMGTSICIEDIDGKPLIGVNSESTATRYPVKLLEEVIGWVIGEYKTPAIALLLSSLAQQQYEKKLLAKELLEKYQEIDTIYDISTQVTRSLDLKELAELVLEEARKLIRSTNGSILLLDHSTGRFQVLWEYGEICVLDKPLILGEGIVGVIIQSGRGEIINDVLCDPRFTDSQTCIRSLICVPLKTKRQVIGAIAISSKTPTTYSTEDLKLLTMLALQTAVAIEKALLYQQNCNALQLAHEQTQQLQRTLYEFQQIQTKLIQSEKLSSLGQLVADIAHEINNPINYVSGNLSHAQQYIQEILHLLQLYQKHYPQPVSEIQAELDALDVEFIVEDLTKLLSSMLLGVSRIRQMALSLRNFSRLDQAEMKPVDIHEGIDSTLLILQSRLKPKDRNLGIQVIKEYGDIPLVEGYANQINQVFMNIIANAIDALEEVGSESSYAGEELSIPTPKSITQNPQIHISTQVLDSNRIKIQFTDNGPGIPESVQKRLFEPFFTTKPAGKGTGLGLSISYQIIEKHRGSLECLSVPGGGTTFSIEIPITQTTPNSSKKLS